MFALIGLNISGRVLALLYESLQVFPRRPESDSFPMIIQLKHESNGSAVNAIQSIVFPPPRPKRKPLHPYPCKPVACSPGLNEQERSPSPNLLVAERETRSPTSVLSRVDSDSFESAIPEQTLRSLSPSSCHAETHSMSNSHTEKGNDCMASNSSKEGKARVCS